MKRFFLVATLFAVAGLVHADLRGDLLAARRKQEKAVRAKDSSAVKAAMLSSLTTDFVYIQGKDRQDAKTYTKNYLDTLAVLTKIDESSMRIVQLHSHGSKGDGKIELRMRGVMQNSDKKPHKIFWVGLFTEEFRREHGHWKTSKITAGPQKFFMDGKKTDM